MKQVLLKQGQPIVEEVPVPQIEPGMVLVQVSHSCISTGTEMSALRANGASLWKRALKQPEKALHVMQLAATQGLTATRTMVEGKLSAAQPSGYSAAGRVLAVGEGVEGLRPGDRVACAGAQCAYHAEVIRVPPNLVVAVPDGVTDPAASTVALGAIALQGVRRLQPTIGESFVVLGLGIIGQLVAQILHACGCRVIGTDVDRSRLQLAAKLGLAVGLHPDDQDSVAQVARLTNGIGADGVVITAQSPSDHIVSTAFQLCRKKGRVVLVGDVGLQLNRADFYHKEIDFLISSSYGPGRYDTDYEERGLDYPIAYVRWTENGNMAEYLRLVAEGKVQILPLVAMTYPVEDAALAYTALQHDTSHETPRPLVVLLSYPLQPNATRLATRVRNPTARPSGTDRIRIALIGAGSFAKSMHLPQLQALSKHFHIQAVVSRTGHNATVVARQYGAAYASTDYQQVLDDPQVDAVLIATRHDQHAALTVAALRARKHVLVEKPLALSDAELETIRDFYGQAEEMQAEEMTAASALVGLPILVTGFNRRFSACARRLRALTQTRTNPMILNYRMNAGYLPPDHWTQTAEGGGRNKGEACHIYDLFTYLTDDAVTSVHAQALRPRTRAYGPADNFITTLAFQDGSVGCLTYTALGTPAYPKEQLEIFVDGKVLALNDYRQVTVHGTPDAGLRSRGIDKGHREELLAFARAIRRGGAWPIPLWQQLQATQISFDVEQYLRADQSYTAHTAPAAHADHAQHPSCI